LTQHLAVERQDARGFLGGAQRWDSRDSGSIKGRAGLKGKASQGFAQSLGTNPGEIVFKAHFHRKNHNGGKAAGPRR